MACPLPSSAALIPTIARLDSGGWRFTWSGGSAPYSIWLDGELIATTTTAAYDFERSGYETTPPPLEILGSGASSQGEAYPPFLELQWRGLQGAHGYLVEQWNGSAWAEKGVVDEDGSGHCYWTTQAQSDGSSAQFRVTAINRDGSGGAALSFTMSIVRNPAPPSVSITLAGGVVTVSTA